MVRTGFRRVLMLPPYTESGNLRLSLSRKSRPQRLQVPSA